MVLKRLFYIVAILVMALTLASCEQMKISDINADPGHFMNKDVGVVGKVTQSFGAMGKGVYEVDDGTGHLWVWSAKDGVPSKGIVVGVKGRVIPTVTFLGVNYTTVLQESARKDEKTAR